MRKIVWLYEWSVSVERKDERTLTKQVLRLDLGKRTLIRDVSEEKPGQENIESTSICEEHDETELDERGV